MGFERRSTEDTKGSITIHSCCGGCGLAIDAVIHPPEIPYETEWVEIQIDEIGPLICCPRCQRDFSRLTPDEVRQSWRS